jgi:hypothetical protein
LRGLKTDTKGGRKFGSSDVRIFGYQSRAETLNTTQATPIISSRVLLASSKRATCPAQRFTLWASTKPHHKEEATLQSQAERHTKTAPKQGGGLCEPKIILWVCGFGLRWSDLRIFGCSDLRIFGSKKGWRGLKTDPFVQ